MAIPRAALRAHSCIHLAPRAKAPFHANIALSTSQLSNIPLRPPRQTAVRALSVPSEAWDTHIHVAEPERFPPSNKAVYKVHTATLAEAFENANRLSVPNIVFVQTSTYGTDNAWILDCLQRVKENTTRKARGVVVLEPESEEARLKTLREWDEVGVRGLRLNFASVGKDIDAQQIATLLRAYAELIRPLRRWSIHLYMPLRAVPGITHELVDELGVKIVIDHIGNPPALASPMKQYPGWSELLTLLEHPDVFVKISAPYRFTDDTEFHDMQTPVRELMGVRGGDGVVFASDWPHTRFEETNIKPWVDRCLEWCDNDEALASKLFTTNAERLFDMPK